MSLKIKFDLGVKLIDFEKFFTWLVLTKISKMLNVNCILPLKIKKNKKKKIHHTFFFFFKKPLLFNYNEEGKDS